MFIKESLRVFDLEGKPLFEQQQPAVVIGVLPGIANSVGGRGQIVEA